MCDSAVPLLLVDALRLGGGRGHGVRERLGDFAGDGLVRAEGASTNSLVKLLEVGQECLGNSLLIYGTFFMN